MRFHTFILYRTIIIKTIKMVHKVLNQAVPYMMSCVAGVPPMASIKVAKPKTSAATYSSMKVMVRLLSEL